VATSALRSRAFAAVYGMNGRPSACDCKRRYGLRSRPGLRPSVWLGHLIFISHLPPPKKK
jgi:hypothetical protein